VPAAAGRRVDARLDAVDSNGLLPMRATDKVFLTAYSFRSYMQGVLREHLASWPAPITFDDLPVCPALPADITSRWPATPVATLKQPAALLAALPIDHSVAPVERRGGPAAARATLRRFVTERLERYVQDHSHPDPGATARLPADPPF